MKRWVTLARAYLDGLGSEPVIAMCCASAMLVLSHYQGSTGYFHTTFGAMFKAHPALAALAHLWWFGSSIVLYLLFPLILAVATRGKFHRAYGLGLGDVRAGLTISLVFLVVMLPAVWWAAQLDTFKGMYPLAGPNAYSLSMPDGKMVVSWKLFAVYELGYLLYFVAWEFLFRGYLVNAILPAYGRTAAIIFQVAPFVVMHLGKPELEALGSIVAGVALGVLAVRARSFWYGALIHGSVALWMDWLSAKAGLFAGTP